MITNDLTLEANHLAYALKDKTKFKKKLASTEEKFKDAGWRVAYNSYESTETNKFTYKAVTFMNDSTKEVHIATAGTTSGLDCVDDAIFYADLVPYKLDPAKAMVSKTIALLGKKVDEYTFSTSGHSLGALMSDLTAGEIMSRGLKFAKSTTFENPGSRVIISRAIDKKLFSGTVEKSVEEIAEHAEVLNNVPNFINTCKPQLGKVYVSRLYDTKDKPEVSKSNGLSNWSSYLYGKIGKTVSKVSDCLGVSATKKQIASHSLKSFDEVNDAIYADNWKDYGGSLLYKKTSKPLFSNYSRGEEIDLLSQKEIDDNYLLISKYPTPQTEIVGDDNEYVLVGLE